MQKLRIYKAQTTFMVSLSLAQKNVTRKQERSLLTIVGVILAVGAFVALLSIAEGLYYRLNREVYSRNIDIYILPSNTIPLPTGPIGAIGYTSDAIYVQRPIYRFKDEPAGKGPEKGRNTPAEKPVMGNIIDYLRLPADDGSDQVRELYARFGELRKIDNIAKAIGVTRFQENIKGMMVIIWGIPFEYEDYTERNFLSAYLPGFRVIQGDRPVVASGKEYPDPYCISQPMKISDLAVQDPNSTEADSLNLDMIMGEKIARELSLSAGGSLPLKRGIDTINLRIRCIGRFNAGFQDYFCFMPIQTALTLQGSPGKVNEIWLKVQNRSDLEKTKRQLQSAFPDLTVKTSYEYLGASSEIVKYAWLLQFAVALIGILIATTASMNTMLMSTFERIREFGALRAIGTPRSTIISMIFIESLILSITGGIFGIIVGLLGSKFLDSAVIALFQTSFPLAHITVNLIIYAFSLSIMIGIAGAIIPAIIVYRIDVIQLLRWE